MISQTAEYALRSVVFLGRNSDGPATTQQIARGTRMPSGYLSKVLQAMAKAGLVQSQRGLHGGFVLLRPLDRLTVLEVINAVDPLRKLDRCPLGIPSHDPLLCPLHRRIEDAIESIEKAFAGVTIRQLLDEETQRKVLCSG